MWWKFALQGRLFQAGDGDANDRVTAQTSFADTTPTFSLEVPAGKIAVPKLIYLGQGGTVAGNVITVNIATSNAAISRASGGTAEAITGRRTDKPVNPGCTLYSNPTATTALLVTQQASWDLAQDVAPAEGAVQEVIWTPEKFGPLILVGPCALGVFTYAGTTAPTWNWTFVWAEPDAGWLVN
jgi:hypothetical protein